MPHALQSALYSSESMLSFVSSLNSTRPCIRYLQIASQLDCLSDWSSFVHSDKILNRFIVMPGLHQEHDLVFGD